MRKKVAIVGMATTSRHLAPFDDDEFEIWALNESYWGGHVGPDKTPYLKRWDRWFQLHPEWDYTRPHNFNHPLHKQWLFNEPWTEAELAAEGDKENPLHREFLAFGATNAHRRGLNFPIYMLEVDDRVPGSALYPIKEILESYGDNAPNMRWFTNSYAYMAALAIHLGFEEIHYYGFEMASTEEYGHQRSNAVFWNAVAIGKGIKVVEPEGCKLMGQYDELYGYEKIPGITKMHLEIEKNNYKKETLKASTELERIRGEKRRVESELGEAMKSKQKGRIERSRKSLEELLNKEVMSLITMNSMHAAQQVVAKHERDIDGLPSPETIKLIPLGGRIRIT